MKRNTAILAIVVLLVASAGACMAASTTTILAKVDQWVITGAAFGKTNGGTVSFRLVGDRNADPIIAEGSRDDLLNLMACHGVNKPEELVNWPMFGTDLTLSLSKLTDKGKLIREYAAGLLTLKPFDSDALDQNEFFICSKGAWRLMPGMFDLLNKQIGFQSGGKYELVDASSAEFHTMSTEICTVKLAIRSTTKRSTGISLPEVPLPPTAMQRVERETHLFKLSANCRNGVLWDFDPAKADGPRLLTDEEMKQIHAP